MEPRPRWGPEQALTGSRRAEHPDRNKGMVDLTDDESVNAAVKQAADGAGGPIASVIHLAASYDTTGEENPKYEAVTVQGTRRLLESLKAVGTEQFVFSSPLLVHAPSPEVGTSINEDSPIDPPWAYPRSKADTEERRLHHHPAAAHRPALHAVHHSGGRHRASHSVLGR